MRKVYEAENYIDAQITRGWLDAAGVDVLLAGEHLGGAMGELPAFGLHSLWVPDDQAAAAEAALLELRAQRADTDRTVTDAEPFGWGTDEGVLQG
jgi:hypothetical protein